MQILRPVRVSRTYTQMLAAAPERVFPLLCPVRETEWVNGWDPRLVISESGYVEPDCVFVVPGEPDESTWVVTRWDPNELRVEFIKVTPGFTVGKIEIQLRRGEQDRTRADITYTYTALGDAGTRFVEQFTPEYYRAFMEEWEGELNYYLQNGRSKPRE